MKLYNFIENLMRSDSKYRNSDRKIIWAVWDNEGRITNSWEGESQVITDYSFVLATSPETCRRTAQKIRAKYPELQSDKKILALKKLKESTKGNFVFGEEVNKHTEDLNQFDKLSGKLF